MGERILPSTNSLVKYNVPQIVSSINEKEDRGRTKKVIRYVQLGTKRIYNI